jgi:hypothetical protein
MAGEPRHAMESILKALTRDSPPVEEEMDLIENCTAEIAEELPQLQLTIKETQTPLPYFVVKLKTAPDVVPAVFDATTLK